MTSSETLHRSITLKKAPAAFLPLPLFTPVIIVIIIIIIIIIIIPSRSLVFSHLAYLAKPLSLPPFPNLPLTSINLPSHLPTHPNHNITHRPLAPHTRVLNLSHHIHALGHSAENNVFVVEEGGGDRDDEELGAVC